MNRTSIGGPFGRLEHIINAVGAHDVGDLVRIGDDGGRPVDERRLRKLARCHQTGLEVDVRVDEAGQTILPVMSYSTSPSYRPSPTIRPFAHAMSHVRSSFEKTLTYVAFFQHQIGLFSAGGRLDHALLRSNFR